MPAGRQFTISTGPQRLCLLDVGRQDYRATWELQQRRHRERVAGAVPDTLIVVEHEPVYTLGRNADRSHLRPDYPRQVPVYQVERGGDITWHGPGQLVGYPILDLHAYRLSAGWFVHALEDVLIAAVADFGLAAERRLRYTGVWIGDEKIAALGVRLARWVSMHGFALNVNSDLRYFDGIVPCGLADLGVTSMERALGRDVSVAEVKPRVLAHFRRRFDVEWITDEAAVPAEAACPA